MTCTAYLRGMSFDPKTLLGLQTTPPPRAILGRPRVLARGYEAASIAELDQVTISREVESDDGDTVPAGATGTVVGIWAGGAAFEVEFAEPVSALATVKADAILSYSPR